MDATTLEVETDPRWPSGRWVGFFMDKRIAGKHQMELLLTFRQGEIVGEGRDKVGQFLVRGAYTLSDGKSHWHKCYVQGHDVFYRGYAEEKGIWGTWELHPKELHGHVQGGFHIWPEGFGDSSSPALAEEADARESMLEPAQAGSRSSIHGPAC